MVLESLFSPKKIINKPIDMLIMSIIISGVCIFAAHFIFPTYAGIISPLLVTAAMAPLIYRIFSIEEEVEREEAERKINLNFMQRHGETILLFGLFFLGNLVSFFFVATFLPDQITSSLFAPQMEEIKRIQSIATGSVLSDGFVMLIALNNLKVMGFSFLLSFLFGTGALFILGWNASILGVYFANFIKQGDIAEFFNRALGIAPHAPIEIGGYFLAGIAGGILSVGIIREKFGTPEFNIVMKDSLLLLGLGVVAIIVGAYVEVYL